MNEHSDYDINLDVRYQHLETIDVPALVSACTRKWCNQTLTQVNDSVVRLGIVEGGFHWHQHEHDDEFFFVLDGRLLIDLADRTIDLGPQQGLTVTRGLMHRTRALQKTVMLMVETAAVVPTGTGEQGDSPPGGLCQGSLPVPAPFSI